MVCLSACAANTGVVPIGRDSYMVSKQGWISTQAVGSLTADVYRQANQSCAGLGKQFQVVSLREQPGDFGRSYPEVELSFRCLAAGDPELQRPTLKPTANVRIEDAR